MKYLLTTGIFLAILASSSVAFGQVPEDYQQAEETFRLLVEAYKSGQWPLFSGLIIMLLIFVSNKAGLESRLDKKIIPWISVTIGVLTSIGTSLVAGIPVGIAIAQGLTAGTAAIGLWELIFKHVLKGNSDDKSTS